MCIRDSTHSFSPSVLFTFSPSLLLSPSLFLPLSPRYTLRSLAPHPGTAVLTWGVCGVRDGAREAGLHPDAFRTNLCAYGRACQRRMCFFAHDVSELRYVPARPVSVRFFPSFLPRCRSSVAPTPWVHFGVLRVICCGRYICGDALFACHTD
eukprot:722439-Rhodomonas_salina.1